VLDDTVKHITGVEKNSDQHSWQQTKNNSQPDEFSKEKISIKKDEDDSFRNNINPLLLADKMQEQWTTENDKRQLARVSIGEGYVNPAFIGSTDEIASIDFNCSARKHSKRAMHLRKMRLFIISNRYIFLSCI